MLIYDGSHCEGYGKEGSLFPMSREARIRRYLLGTLSEDERQRVEDRYFSQPVILEELVAVENDLMDAYVRRELSPAEAKQFESNYLSSPERRARIEFARCLERARPEFAPQQRQSESAARKFGFTFISMRSPALQWAAVAAAMLVTASGIWLIVQKGSVRTDFPTAHSQQQAPPTTGIHAGEPQTQASTAAAQPAAGSNDLPKGTNIASVSREPVLIFTPNSEAVRSVAGSGNRLTIPPKISSVLFRVPITGATYPKYQADLQTVDRQTIQTSKSLKSRNSNGQQVVYFRVPSSRLTPGDYVVRLSGEDAAGRLEEIQAFSFRALGK